MLILVRIIDLFQKVNLYLLNASTKKRVCQGGSEGTTPQ